MKKYKTVRQSYIGFTIIFFVGCVFAGIVVMTDDLNVYPIILAPFSWIIGLIPLVYCLSYNTKRIRYKKKGVCISGYIIGAYRTYSYRGSQRYYLKIKFSDDGNKVLCTEGYVGDPNDFLSNCKCNIYKLGNSYIEADINTIRNGEKLTKKKIPIDLTYYFSHSEIGMVKDL